MSSVTAQQDIPARLRAMLAAYKARQFDEAEKLGGSILAEAPGEPDTLALLAQIYVDTGRKADAEQLLLTARDHRPDTHLTWTNLGRFYQMNGRWGDAEALYEQAVAALPDFPLLHMTLGQIQQRAGKFAAAEASFRKVIALRPGHGEAYSYLGMVLLRQEKIGEAITTLKEATRLDPEKAAGFGNLGNAYQKLGDLEAAATAYDKAVALNPKDPLAYVSLGLVQLKRGHAREAAEIFERTLAQMGPERRAAAWLPFARAQEMEMVPGGYRSELGRLIRRVTLDTPEGYASKANLNASLAAALISHPTLQWEPLGKSTRKGGQTGLLLDSPAEPFISFEKMLRKGIDAFFDGIRREAKHPFFGQVPDKYLIDLWGTVLEEDGHQDSHIHVGGWMSGVYYVALPDSMGHGEENQDGWIEFGAPPADFKANFTPLTLSYEPRAGDAFFFPSYVFHRTKPFRGSQPRISLAFDIKPASWRK
ncbi:MAG: tetratricopeptide repeat protein [Parvibaculaceae bacterium]|nr:tetratricopeptide repeat protein [Parvibaculaceae bacterium]